jgi:hypothetical protein
MSDSVLETLLIALVTDLNTSRPGGVPTIERDRWVDVDTLASDLPVCALSGYDDDSHPNQHEDRGVDLRRVKASFEIYAKSNGSGRTASQMVDATYQWLAKRAGPIETGPLAGIANRVAMGRKLAVVGKGDIARCLVEMHIDYRNVVNDVTRVK